MKFDNDTKSNFIKFSDLLGDQILDLFKLIFIFLCNLVLVCVIITKPIIKAFSEKRQTGIKSLFIKILKPIANFLHNFGVKIQKLKKSYQTIGFKQTTIKIFKNCFTIIKSDKKFHKSLLNYSIPVLSIFLAFVVINFGTNSTFAIEVNFDGSHLGYISSEGEFDDAQNILMNRIIVEDGESPPDFKPTFAVTLVDQSEVVSKYGLADNMIRLSSDEIIEANGFYVDDVFYGAIDNPQPIEDTLDQIIKEYSSGAEGEIVNFVNNIELKQGLFINQNIVAPDKIIEKIKSFSKNQSDYVVVSGDSPTTIATKCNIPYSELKKLNPDIEKSLLVGSTIKITEQEPFLSVRRTVTETSKKSTPFKVIEEKSTTLNKGIKNVKTKGVEGVIDVMANVEYVNGTEVRRETISETVVSPPVDQVVEIGQKVVASYGGSRPADSTNVGGGGFMWPVGGSGGRISSYWGDGRGHKGLDIAAPNGTAIYSAQGGKVILARTNSGYGKCVIIDHGNGLQTLYGHASALYVSAGQTVGKGTAIAAVGSTGQSTGNHLHFEVKLNGRQQNPLGYVN